jgi:transposase-like protein
MKKTPGQHFLLSAEARSFSLLEIFRMSSEQAFDLFKKARWTDGKAVCPDCGSDSSYWLKTRKQWRCKDCNHTYSVTSGTIFANHKLPLTTYLAAVALYSNCAKGMSALQLSRDLDVQYKTAFVLCHKLRETLGSQDNSKLKGIVEIDGAYTGNYIRPINRIEDRVDLRLAQNQNPNKRAVIAMRERGTGRTRTFVAKSENQKTTLRLALENIDRSAVIFADEHPAYNALHAHFDTRRVNHKEIYVGPKGESINQCESFFSRFRRMQIGQNHKITNLYLDSYVNESAYREDTRRMSNGAIFSDIATRCAKAGVSRNFCGYWQGNKKLRENLEA